MHKTLSITVAVAALAAGAVAVTAYALSSSNEPAAQLVSSTSAPRVSSEPTPTPPAPAYVVPKVGAVVAAADVETARAAGASVYVSPRGDGDGIVVDPDAKIVKVAFDDLYATSQSSLTNKQLASVTIGSMDKVLDPDLVSDVRAAVRDANYRLFVVYTLLAWNDPKTNGRTHRAGWGGGYQLSTVEESKAMNKELQKALVEGVPVGKQSLAHQAAITASPKAYLAAAKDFLAKHPAQVVILKK